MKQLLNESTIVAVAFIIFVIALYKPAKLFILKFLDAKLANALKDIREAAELRDEAKALNAECKMQLAETRITCTKILENAREKATQILQNAHIEIENIIRKKTEVSNIRINQQEHQIIEEFKNEAFELALKHIQKTFSKDFSKNAQTSLIENNIKNVKKLLH